VSVNLRAALEAMRKKSGDVAILWNSGNSLIYQSTPRYTIRSSQCERIPGG